MVEWWCDRQKVRVETRRLPEPKEVAQMLGRVDDVKEDEG